MFELVDHNHDSPLGVGEIIVAGTLAMYLDVHWVSTRLRTHLRTRVARDNLSFLAPSRPVDRHPLPSRSERHHHMPLSHPPALILFD